MKLESNIPYHTRCLIGKLGNLILIYPTKINDDITFSLWVHAAERVHFPTVLKRSTIFDIRIMILINIKMFLEKPH